MAAADASPSAARARARPDLAAPAFDPAGAERRPAPAGATSRAMPPAGSAASERADQAQRLEHLVEAHRDARRHVAVALRRHRSRSSRVVGRARRVAAQVERLAAGAAGEPRQAELRAPARGVTRPAPHEAVLQAGVLVVDRRAAARPRARSRRTARRARERAPASTSRATPPGTTRSISSRWPNASSDGAQPVLPAGARTARARTRSPRRCRARRGRRGGWRCARARAAARAATARARGHSQPREPSSAWQ